MTDGTAETVWKEERDVALSLSENLLTHLSYVVYLSVKLSHYLSEPCHGALKV